MLEKLRKTARKYREKIRAWFETYGSKLILFSSVLLAIALAFEGGFLVGRDRRTDPIIITAPADAYVSVATVTEEEKTVEIPKTQTAKDVSPGTSLLSSSSTSKNESESCAFVGSRNSDKYHLPKCSWAKRIKPENRVCFTSAADAESKGYKPGCVK